MWCESLVLGRIKSLFGRIFYCGTHKNINSIEEEEKSREATEFGIVKCGNTLILLHHEYGHNDAIIKMCVCPFFYQNNITTFVWINDLLSAASHLPRTTHFWVCCFVSFVIFKNNLLRKTKQHIFSFAQGDNALHHFYNANICRNPLYRRGWKWFFTTLVSFFIDWFFMLRQNRPS